MPKQLKKNQDAPVRTSISTRKTRGRFSLDEVVASIAGWIYQAFKSVTWKIVFQAAVIVALGVWVYYPSLYGLYLWDDDFLIQNNPVVHAPQGIIYIWTDPKDALIDFFPLTVSFEWLIWQLFWVPDPSDPLFHSMTVYFHGTSLILHLINAMLIWLLFRKMGIRLAWLGALIFTVHPVIVESVAWMAELKNTVAMPPFILAVLAWLAYDATRRGEYKIIYYIISFVLYVIALLCKTSVVMFPVVILLYDWWKHPEINFLQSLISEVKLSLRAVLALAKFGPFGLWKRPESTGAYRQTWADVWNFRWTLTPTIPFFIVAASDAYFLILYLRHGVGEQFIPPLLGGPIGRTACAGMCLIFYFSKCILPLNLMPIYPQWPVAPAEFTLTYALKFLPWPILAFGFWWLLRRRAQPWARTAVFGFGYFFFMIGPFTGWRAISFMRFQWTMDHFEYVPILGLIGLAMAAAGDIYDRLPRNRPIWRIAAVSSVVAIVASFTIGSHLYAEVFLNRLTYWTYTIERNYISWPSHNNRGNQLLENADNAARAGYIDEANADFLEAKKEFLIALQLNPVYTEAWNNLGFVLIRQGDLKQAEHCFRKALEYTPEFESAQMNLSRVLQMETAQLEQQEQQQPQAPPQPQKPPQPPQ